jgi:capsular polysaccharide biosynthesis protein
VDPNPLGKKWARQRALKKEDSNHSHGFSERIFMSRQGGGRRKIKNFQEVKNKLDEFGFGIYRPENLSAKEEVDLFSQANIIAGVTGSNLAGIMFSTDARVMEIFPHNEYLHVYYTLSNELGFEYMYFNGSGEREDSDGGSIHRNIVVDIDELEEHLIEILDK